MNDEAAVALSALTSVFGSLGRILICLDEDFRVVHLSDPRLNFAAGAPIEKYLGEDLFGERGSMRQALVAGERREGWRAFLRTEDGLRLLSISAAPLLGQTPCNDAVKYILVLRPAEEEMTASGPTLLSGLIARSPAMQRVFRLVENLQGSTATILLTGESGVQQHITLGFSKALERSPGRFNTALMYAPPTTVTGPIRSKYPAFRTSH